MSATERRKGTTPIVVKPGETLDQSLDRLRETALKVKRDRDALLEACKHLLAEWDAWQPNITGIAKERAKAAIAAAEKEYSAT